MTDAKPSTRNGGTAPTADSAQAEIGFAAVLGDELELVAARRQRLNAQRGDFAKGADESEAARLQTAWQARLLGLSFSGGGIRSATFNLGVLQALARGGLLRHVDYLSTVSGGGYIGSWFTALNQRRFAQDANGGAEHASLPLNEQGYTEFQERLAWSAGDGAGGDKDREDVAIRFLREFSNYLTPKLGLFSGDTWALIAIYVRNALLNQLVLFLALAGVLLAPRLLAPLLGAAEVSSGAGFLKWMAALLALQLLVCWKVGKNLSGVTARAAKNAERSPRVIVWIGGPLLFVGITATSWLGYLDDALSGLAALLPFSSGAVEGVGLPRSDWRTWLIAMVLGAALSVLTWVCAYASARWHHRGEKWSAIERTFWRRMVLFAFASGPVFGVCLHAAGSWLFTGEIYSGFKLIAGPPAIALAVLVAGTLHVGLAGKDFSSQYTEWLSRFGGLMLIGSFGWIAFNTLVFIGPLLVAWLKDLGQIALSSGWLLTTLGSVIFGRRVASSSSSSMSRLFMNVAPWVFIIGLGVGLAALLQSGLHFGATHYGADAAAVQDAKASVYSRFAMTPTRGDGLLTDYSEWLAATDGWQLIAVAILVAGLLTWGLSRRIDINVFSLHGMYANRLVRCYLGASVAGRTANAFSGLSGRDDLQLGAAARRVNESNLLVHSLADGDTVGTEPLPEQRAAYPGPYHLINTAINLVAGGNLAYQERKAAAFLLSPLYCGFRQDSSSSEGPASKPIDAYRPSTSFSSIPKPLTLGEAVATSGAAASPNMGYHSTPAFAFLMGVFNIRLGRWVGNSHAADKAARDAWRSSSPPIALWYLLREVFGLTDNKSRFVYLSDGGHFENLGIYELVRRRCRYIIACDAGADPRYGFEDLANAIRKCRTDLGVEIDLDVRQIAAVDDKRYNGAPCAVGQIRYSDSQVGTILYIKASRRQGLPSDVMHYATEHTTFPHESTADQFFSESQFESYRRLGHFLAQQILDVSRAKVGHGVDIDQLFRDLAQGWCPPSSAVASNFARLADEVDELFERLRSSDKLLFLSRQFYPEWRSLSGKPLVDAHAQAADLVYIPADEEALKQGFYFCNSLIQLMESVYIDLNLETEWQHPDNSGWVNLFNHWSWSGMFRVTWAVAAATYGRRFRAFCERRLNLDLGVVGARSVFAGRWAQRNLGGSGLNLHEQRMIEALPVGSGDNVEVYCLELRVRQPIDETAEPLIRFGFGYAVFDGPDLIMYRVQDHLRGMGLGRKGLVALVKARAAALGLDGLAPEPLRAFLDKFQEQSGRGRLADFRSMVISVNEEWNEGD